MKRVLSILLVVVAFSSVKAQQDPQFTQWFNDKLSFNPAVAGLNDAHCFSLFYRNQWSGFTAPNAGGGDVAVNPKTFMFNYSGYFGNGIGGGVNFYNDQLGNETNNIVKFSGAYHNLLPAGGPKLSAGLSLGLYQKSLGDNWIFIDENDPSIPNQGPSQGTFDLGLGLYLYDSDYYVGLSATHLTAADLDELGIAVARHYFFMAGKDFNLPSGGVPMLLRTNLLAKSDFNKTALDVNANVLFNNMFYAGLSYRLGDAIAPMVGIEHCISKNGASSVSNQCFKAGYSYDVTTSDLNTYSSGSHEIFLSYCIKLTNKVIISKHSNPRFL